MKARDIVGRKIVSVQQERIFAEDGSPGGWSVLGFILDNGASVMLTPANSSDDPYVEVEVSRRPRRQAGPTQ